MNYGGACRSGIEQDVLAHPTIKSLKSYFKEQRYDKKKVVPDASFYRRLFCKGTDSLAKYLHKEWYVQPTKLTAAA